MQGFFLENVTFFNPPVNYRFAVLLSSLSAQFDLLAVYYYY